MAKDERLLNIQTALNEAGINMGPNDGYDGQKTQDGFSSLIEQAGDRTKVADFLRERGMDATDVMLITESLNHYAPAVQAAGYNQDVETVQRVMMLNPEATGLTAAGVSPHMGSREARDVADGRMGALTGQGIQAMMLSNGADGTELSAENINIVVASLAEKGVDVAGLSDALRVIAGDASVRAVYQQTVEAAPVEVADGAAPETNADVAQLAEAGVSKAEPVAVQVADVVAPGTGAEVIQASLTTGEEAPVASDVTTVTMTVAEFNEYQAAKGDDVASIQTSINGHDAVRALRDAQTAAIDEVDARLGSLEFTFPVAEGADHEFITNLGGVVTETEVGSGQFQATMTSAELSSFSAAVMDDGMDRTSEGFMPLLTTLNDGSEIARNSTQRIELMALRDRLYDYFDSLDITFEVEEGADVDALIAAGGVITEPEAGSFAETLDGEDAPVVLASAGGVGTDEVGLPVNLLAEFGLETEGWRNIATMSVNEFRALEAEVEALPADTPNLEAMQAAIANGRAAIDEAPKTDVDPNVESLAALRSELEGVQAELSATNTAIISGDPTNQMYARLAAADSAQEALEAELRAEELTVSYTTTSRAGGTTNHARTMSMEAFDATYGGLGTNANEEALRRAMEAAYAELEAQPENAARFAEIEAMRTEATAIPATLHAQQDALIARSQGLTAEIGTVTEAIDGSHVFSFDYSYTGRSEETQTRKFEGTREDLERLTSSSELSRARSVAFEATYTAHLEGSEPTVAGDTKITFVVPDDANQTMLTNAGAVLACEADPDAVAPTPEQGPAQEVDGLMADTPAIEEGEETVEMAEDTTVTLGTQHAGVAHIPGNFG